MPMNMNPDQLEQFFKEAKNVALEQTKKDLMQKEILMCMEKNPFPKTPLKKKWWVWLPVTKVPMIAFASLLFLVVVGVGATVTANSALPGDVLYPVKVGFNEKVKEVLAFSDQSKLKLNISLAELRLQEVEQLAVKGTITSNNQAQLNDNFKKYADKVSTYMGKLEQKQDNSDVETLGTSFEASLKAQSIILNGLQKNPAHNIDAPLLQDINQVTSQVSDTNTKIRSNNHAKKDNIDTKKVIDDKISHVENSVKNVRKLLNSSKKKIGADAVFQSEENLNLIQQKIDEGKNKSSSDYESAISSLNEASVLAQQSRDLIKAKSRLKVDIPINILPAKDSNNHQ